MEDRLQLGCSRVGPKKIVLQPSKTSSPRPNRGKENPILFQSCLFPIHRLAAGNPQGQGRRRDTQQSRPGAANGQAARAWHACAATRSRPRAPARGMPAPLRGSAGAQGGRTAGRGLHPQLQRRTGPAAAAQVQRQRATTTAHRPGMN